MMKDYFAPVIKEFDYSAFISDLEPLIAQAREFDVGERHYDGDVFRAWRHKVEDLVTKIKRTHMDVNCALDTRRFQIMSYSNITSKDQLKAFDRDLRDTLVELDYIIDWHKKYGPPKPRNERAAKPSAKASEPVAIGPATPRLEPAPEPRWPEKDKLTLYWLFKNMPLSAWLVVGGIFTAGTFVGGWPVLQKVVDRWLEAAPPKAAIQSPQSPPAKQASK